MIKYKNGTVKNIIPFLKKGFEKYRPVNIYAKVNGVVKKVYEYLETLFSGTEITKENTYDDRAFPLAVQGYTELQSDYYQSEGQHNQDKYRIGVLSGNIVQFEDGQNGTEMIVTSDVDCVVTRCGRNLLSFDNTKYCNYNTIVNEFNEQTINIQSTTNNVGVKYYGYKIIINNNGNYTIKAENINDNIGHIYLFGISKDTTKNTLHVGGNISGAYVISLISTDNLLKGFNINIPSDIDYICLTPYLKNDTPKNACGIINNITLELGSTSHSYEPYQGQTYNLVAGVPTKIPLLDGCNTVFSDTGNLTVQYHKSPTATPLDTDLIAPLSDWESPIISNIPSGNYKITTDNGIFNIELPFDLYGDTVKDIVKLDSISGKCWAEKNWNKVIFDSSTNFKYMAILENEQGYFAHTFINDKRVQPDKKVALLCTHAVAIDGSAKNTINTCSESQGTTAVYLCLPTSCGTTATEWQAYFEQQKVGGTPVTLLYQKAQTTKTNITATKVSSSSYPELPTTHLGLVDKSPDYPQTFYNAQNFDLISRGRNIANHIPLTTSLGVTVSQDNTGKISLSGVSTSAGYINIPIDIINLNGIYTMSVIFGENTNVVAFEYRKFNKQTGNVSDVIIGGVMRKGINENDTKNINDYTNLISMWVNGNVNYSGQSFYIQITKGSAPYKTHFLSPLESLEITKSEYDTQKLIDEYSVYERNSKYYLCNYKMKYFDNDSKSWKCKKVIQIARENVTTCSGVSSSKYFYTAKNKIKDLSSGKIISDKLIHKYSYAFWANSGFAISAGNRIYYNLSSTALEKTVEEGQAELDAIGGFEVQYFIEPITTDITDTAEGQALLNQPCFYPYTSLSTNADIQPNITAKIKQISI